MRPGCRKQGWSDDSSSSPRSMQVGGISIVGKVPGSDRLKMYKVCPVCLSVLISGSSVDLIQQLMLGGAESDPL